ncbi:hypothetical protein K438DRAFT_1771705 [Mycena galopus ATCC 62051]|nr:hypothetical protein K438DRAFT_1771705 [Mycena galopus ATCC 62051]
MVKRSSTNLMKTPLLQTTELHWAGLLTRGQNILCLYARALLVLRGHGQWEECLQILADNDVCGLNERALTTEKKAQNELRAEIGGAIIEGRVAHTADRPKAAPESANNARLEEFESQLYSLWVLRVEWCKALACSRRNHEEVWLLREEMRRMIAYGKTAAREWERLVVGLQYRNMEAGGSEWCSTAPETKQQQKSGAVSLCVPGEIYEGCVLLMIEDVNE